MTTATVNYSSASGITCTVTSLGINGYRGSVAISNATTKYVDVLISGSIQVGAVGADGAIEIYGYGSIDGGTVYSGGLTSSDQLITWGTTPSTTSIFGYNQIAPVGSIAVSTSDDNNDIEFGPFSLAYAFGGVVPISWGIVVRNNTDIALHATGTNNTLDYVGVRYDAA